MPVYFFVHSEIFEYDQNHYVHDLSAGFVMDIGTLQLESDGSRILAIRGVPHMIDYAGDLWYQNLQNMSWDLTWLYDNLLDAMMARTGVLAAPTELPMLDQLLATDQHKKLAVDSWVNWIIFTSTSTSKLTPATFVPEDSRLLQIRDVMKRDVTV
ncbi:hypothetical protein RhiJN_22342 [Ceratobasidium sp. AG-Ba]|nr:hypothetical protein RhiJN_22342 [Ceratobasidium sp. AG-Ba]